MIIISFLKYTKFSNILINNKKKKYFSGRFVSYFLIYRIGGLMMFNNEIIDNEEKILSKHIFL